MKKLLLLVILSLLSQFSFCQNANDAMFDTNGPMGDILFPENEKGDVVISEIVDAPFNSDTLKALAMEFLNLTDQSKSINIFKIHEGITKITAHVDIKVGTRLWENPAPFAPPIEKAKSTVDFSLLLEFRDGKYKFTLSNFNTDRWRIKGDGKDQGPSNRIHWQRINSINKDFKKAKTRNEMIEAEQIAYQDEYQAVLNFVDQLKSFATITPEF